MPHIKTNKQYEEVKERTIYALVSPFEHKVFVGNVIKSAERNRYKNHYTLRHSQTKNMVSEVKTQGGKPKMYRLRTLKTTEAEAKIYCLAWTKYFIEKGYESVAYKRTNEYAMSNSVPILKLFEEIRIITIEEILSDEREMFADYKGRDGEKIAGETVTISFRVNKKEAEIIRRAAEKREINITQYCRITAIDGCVVDVDFDFFATYLDEIRALRRLILLTAQTVYQTKTYYPPDLKKIQQTADLIAEHEEKIRKDLMDTMKKARKDIRAARRK